MPIDKPGKGQRKKTTAGVRRVATVVAAPDLIVVLDRAKARLFEFADQTLTELASLIDSGAKQPARARSSDRPGRVFSRVGGGRSAVGDANAQQNADAERFVGDVVANVKRLRPGNYGRVVVFAPAKMLGYWRRKVADQAFSDKIVERRKDLAKANVSQIAKLL